MTTLMLIIDKDGSVRHLYSDEFAELSRAIGEVDIKRASHVEPTNDGRWTADMAPSDGPVLGPFDRRGDALAAEVRWLEEHDLMGG